MAKADRSGEHDIAHAAMRYLETIPSMSATTTEVKRHIPNFINLTDGDQEQSDSRDNEQRWQQVVGNIVSHRNDSPENFINRGLIAYDSGVWSLTEAGQRYLKKR